jgi:hypothetical protein
MRNRPRSAACAVEAFAVALVFAFHPHPPSFDALSALAYHPPNPSFICSEAIPLDSLTPTSDQPNPAAPAKPQPPAWAPLLALSIFALAVFIIWKAFPFSLWLIGCFILWIIPQDQRFKDKIWARILSALAGPALAAFVILTTFVAALKLFDSRSATTIANWEDRLILTLHASLKHFTIWEYLAILATATLINALFPALNAVDRIQAGKKWLDTTVAIVAIIANVSFLGQNRVVAPRYDDAVSRITETYRELDKEKTEHIDSALAIQALAQNLQSASDEDKASIRNSISALDRLQLPMDYRDKLAEDMVARVDSNSNSSFLKEFSIDTSVTSDANAISSAEPDRLIAATEKLRQDADEAAHQETQARAGLRNVLTTLIDQGDGKIVDTAMHFCEPFIGGIGLEILKHVTDAIHDQSTDSLNDWFKNHQKPLLDIALPRTAEMLHWNGLPQEPVEQLTADLRIQAIERAVSNREQAANDLKELAETGKSSLPGRDDPEKSIQSDKSDGEEADQVLHQLGSAPQPGPQSGTAQPDPASSTAYWDAAARPAEKTVASQRQKAQEEEERNRKIQERTAEPK